MFRLPWQKRSVEDEIEDLLILMKSVRGDPDRRGEYLSYVDACVDLYKVRSEEKAQRNMLVGGILGGLAEMLMLSRWGATHIIPPDWKWLHNKVGGLKR